MDKIVVAYQLQMDQAEAEVKDFEKTLRSAESTGKKTFSTVASESKKAGIAMEKTSGNVDTLKNKLSNLTDNLPFAAQAKQVLELGNAVTGLGGATQSASSGFKILRAAIITSGIGALVIGIIALISYMRRTDEGATRLAGVMSALGAATDLVTGFVVGLGEGVFNAFTSVENFKEGLSNLGDFIATNLLNRVKGFITLFESLQLAVGGEFVAASKRFVDATFQMSTGITDITSKSADFAEKAALAAAAAFEWEQRMDALQDKIREDSTVIAENDRAITKLIIASKNKNIEDEKSLGFLDEATRLERENLAVTLQNETAKLKLIQERNKRESDSINQDITAGQKRRSINDTLNQEERDQINKLIQIRQASDNLLEKVNNRRDAKLEEIFQNNVKRLQQEEEIKENLAKQDFLNQTTTAQQLEDALYNIKLEGLQAQKELFVTEGRDIVDIDKAILDLQLQNRLKSDKEKADLIKAANADELKQQEELAKDALRLLEEENAEVIKKREQRKKDIQTIEQGSVQFAEELATGLFNANQERRQMELSEELEKTKQENDAATNALQLRLNRGLISEEQFKQQKAILDDKQAKKEAEIKRKQFQANKKAQLTDIAINTAAAIVKTLATLGIPAGIAGAAVAAALGLAQAAVVLAQPVPKFKDGKVNIEGPGTGTSDSILARLSKGETVTSAKQTQKHMGLLQAMHEDKAEDYIQRSYVSPALRKMDAENSRAAIARREKREGSLHSIISNLATDTSQLEYLTKKNKNVKLENAHEIAKILAQEIHKNNSWYK